MRMLSQKTIMSYQQSFRAVRAGLAEEYTRAADLRHDLKTTFMGITKAGKRTPAGINIAVRSINVFTKWLLDEQHLDTPVKVKRLKEPKLEVLTLADLQIQEWMEAKAHDGLEEDVKMLVLLILDTGLRVQEALNLKGSDFDWDMRMLKVIGKGNKFRLVPFSVDLRKLIYRKVAQSECEWAFPTGAGTRIDYANAYHCLKSISRRLGIRMPKGFHTLRHTMATNYIRNGGSTAHLQRILGHSSISTTGKYVHLQTEDLQRVHEKYSILSQMSKTKGDRS